MIDPEEISLRRAERKSEEGLMFHEYLEREVVKNTAVGGVFYPFSADMIEEFMNGNHGMTDTQFNALSVAFITGDGALLLATLLPALKEYAESEAERVAARDWDNGVRA